MSDIAIPATATDTVPQYNVLRPFDAGFVGRLKHVTQTVSCPVHGEQQVVLIDWGSGFLPKATCPVCEEEESARERDAARRRRQEGVWQKRGIAREFFGATVANYAVKTPAQKAARDAVRELCEGKLQKVVLLGRNGVGKTHLACAAVKHLGGKIVTAFALALRIRMTYAKGANESELDVLDELARLPFLAIDELGRGKNSDAVKDWLSYVLDRRHSEGLPFMICTNAHLAADCPEGGCDGCFENLVGSDVLSRLQQSSRIVSLAGVKDWRGK